MIQSQDLEFNFIDCCREVIALDSSPQASTVELVEYLARLANDMGFVSEIQFEQQNGELQANLIVRFKTHDKNNRDFLLQTHLDTTDPGHFPLWKKNNSNPFEACIHDGRIYGLGAAEVKIDFIVKLFALYELKNMRFSTLNPILVGTFGEETGMHGALKLIRKNKIQAKYALLGEPSHFDIINAAKGFATVQVRIPWSESEKKYKQQRLDSESLVTQTKLFSGKSAHSSTPHLGDSAAIKLFEYLQKMPSNVAIHEIDAGTRYNMIPHQAMVELDVSLHIEDAMIEKLNYLYNEFQNVQNQMKLIKDHEFEPHHSTLSIGIIRSLEDEVIIGGSCRILPAVKQDEYESWILLISKACLKIGAKFDLQDYKKPFRTDEQSVLVKGALAELEKLGLSSKCRSIPSTNEASLFSRIGIECICFGAGERENNIHTPNESVALKDLELAQKFYQSMIERFCL